MVKVEFGKKISAGIVLQIQGEHSCADDQKIPLKMILEYAKHLEMSPQMLNLCQFASRYYLKPIGEVLFSSVPGDWKKPAHWGKLEKQKIKIKRNKNTLDASHQEGFWDLNEEQKQCLQILQASYRDKHFEVFLLKGVTGSGKTAVYLSWLAEILKDPAAQCLILVPEINLTPQLEKIVKQVFINEEVSVLHSNITSAQRNTAWWKIQNGLSRVVLGTRLSIFAPLKNLSVIVVDEEHDASYKQQDGLRYNARDLAIWRAAESKIPIILTSATPSSESWQKVMGKKIQLLSLNKKAKDGASTAKLHLINITLARKNKHIDDFGIATSIKQVITDTWKNKKQTLIYINRRGYAPVLYCGACAWKSQCQQCSAWAVVHKKNEGSLQKYLQCHHCGTRSQAPKNCPDCGNQDLATLGMGTQKIEEYFTKNFPQMEIIRVDSDTTNSKRRAAEVFQKIHDGESQIIIGTQMVIKGHDFQNIQSIIVLDVDKSLFSQDFRAVEKMYSQLVQVAGRAGRSGQTQEANIYIQTEFVDHPLFAALSKESDDDFITEIVNERQAMQLPPFTHQALVIAESKSEVQNMAILKDLKAYLEEGIIQNMQIGDPCPRVLQRLSGVDRHQILIESHERIAMQTILEKALDYIESLKKKTRSIKLSIDRDPLQF